MATDVKFCGNCGERVRRGSRFCVSCGALVAPATPAAEAASIDRRPPPTAPPAEDSTERTILFSPPQTSEPTPPPAPAAERRVGSLLARFVALLIDGLALAGVLFLIGALVANTTDDPTRWGFDLQGTPAGIVAGLSLLVYVLYYALMEGLAGATLGKLVLGLRVERRDGAPAGLAAALVRNLLRIVDVLPTAYIVGLIAALTSPLRQRIGDRAAGTVVNRARRSAGTRFVALAAAALLLAGGVGAGLLLRDPAAQVTATLARGVTADNRPTDATDVFAPTQDVIHLAFEVAGARPGAQLRSVWYVVDVGASAPPDSFIDEATVTLDEGRSESNFRLRRGPNPWPVGEYKVELYLDDELVQTLPFSVRR